MTTIWHRRPSCEALNRAHIDTACASLGIEITEIGDDYLVGTMPVDTRTVQVTGLLHGGASVLLAETLGSAAAMHVVDTDRFTAVGTAISANHLRSATSGKVTGRARPRHLGRSSQLWEIDVVDEQGGLVSLCRLTVSVLPMKR
jgi:1,4-dihydroxy-2-naphthoyl-CoA hydrolase